MASTPKAPLPRDVWVLVGASFVIAMGYGLVAPVLPGFAQSFDVSVTAATIVVSAFAFTRLIFAPASGRLVSAIGSRPTYITGLLIVAASSAASGLAQNYWQLLVFRGLGGLGSTMFTVSAMSLIIALAPPKARGRASAAFGSGFLLGNVTGPALGAVLAGLGMRAPFIIYAALLIVAAIIVFVLIRPVDPDEAKTQQEIPEIKVSEAMQNGAYRGALVAAFAQGWTNMGARMALIPLFAVTLAGAGQWASGAALAIYAIGMLIGLNYSGRAVDRRGRHPILLTGLIFSGLVTAVVGVSWNVWILLVLTAAAGVAASLITPAMQAVVADVVGRERRGGTVVARFQMSQDAGAILGPIGGGLIVDYLNYEAAFLLCGLLLLVAALRWRTAPETMDRDPSDS